MADYDFKIDPQTKDLVWDGDDFETVEGVELTLQSVQLTLNARQGEFLLDETHGMEFQRILEKNESNFTLQDIQDVVREAVLQEPGVRIIDTINVKFESRRIIASFTGRLADGTEITSTVEV